MVYQLNIQTIPLTRRSHLIVGVPAADTAAWVGSITAAVRRPRIGTACLPGCITSSLTLTTCPGWPGPDAGTRLEGPLRACGRDRDRDPRERGRLRLTPVTDPKTAKNRLHLDLTSSAQGPGPSWPAPGETSPA